jgi:branched-chain amino acid aminotransferase
MDQAETKSVWINGDFIDEADASISLRDTGLLHAAGVFTTMRSYAGRVFRLDRHLQRLRASCEALFIPLQQTDQALTDVVHQLLERNHLSDARLRLTVTRGMARHDPLHGLHLQPNIFLTATDLEPYPQEFYEKGLTVIVLDEQKLNPYDLQAGHKTLNYFSRLAALREATRRGAGEALWFNVHNELQSGSISNVFIIKDNTLLTPPTPDELRQDPQQIGNPQSAIGNTSAVLPGITRQAILELAQQHNIPTQLTSLAINDLLTADEVFLTNSIMQLMPVTRIEAHPIAAATPGPLTRRLADAYQTQIQRQTSAGS